MFFKKSNMGIDTILKIYILVFADGVAPPCVHPPVTVGNYFKQGI